VFTFLVDNIQSSDLISGGSRDTEDWSNDAENIQLYLKGINYILS